MSKVARLELSVVEAFVGAAHGDLDEVKRLLELEPSIVNSCWDWGGGDWETGLGGASHMGRADIARYLLDHGARMDLFCAAMIGLDEIVRSALAWNRRLAAVPGPHGIPLVAHAKAGGHDALASYIQSVAESAQ